MAVVRHWAPVRQRRRAGRHAPLMRVGVGKRGRRGGTEPLHPRHFGHMLAMAIVAMYIK